MTEGCENGAHWGEGFMASPLFCGGCGVRICDAGGPFGYGCRLPYGHSGMHQNRHPDVNRLGYSVRPNYWRDGQRIQNREPEILPSGSKEEILDWLQENVLFLDHYGS
jgi:hypothetical protein